MATDSYFTISQPATGLFKDKGSKFLAFAYPVSSEEEVKECINKLKKEYYDARHHCYAYKIGLNEDRYRMSDDGEPSGTAGKPIYGQILSHSLSDILLVVVRYFGGTLLGTSGLINAYKMASIDCIENANVLEKVIKHPLVLCYSYELMSNAMRIVKEEELDVLEQDFREACRLTVNIRLDDFERIQEKFEKIYGIEVEK